MLWGSKYLQTGLSQALPARCGRLDSASRHTKTRIDCYTAAMDGRLPGPRKRAYFQVPHLVLGRPSRGEKTDGRERHGPRFTSPVSPRPAPDLRYTSPASDRQEPTPSQRVRCHAAGMGGEPWMETGESRHRPFWEAATRPSVSRDQ